MDPLHVRAGEGAANRAFGLPRVMRVTPEATDGAIAIFDEEVPEGAGPPLHIHRTETEIFSVLEGRLRFRAGDTEVEAGPGDLVVIPAGTPHAFKGLGPGPARVQITLSPGHGAGFFAAVEAEGLSVPDDMARIAEIADAHGLDLVGPPLD